MSIRRDWYPSKDRVIIDLFIKKATDVSVEFEKQSVLIMGKHSGIILTLQWCVRYPDTITFQTRYG